MAGNDVVGALYYKVVLDPRGFAKGVTSVKSEQDVLSRAIKSSVSEFDRLQAELDAIGSMYIKSKEEHRKVLQAAQAEIIKQMEELIEVEEKAAKLAEEKKFKQQAKEEADAIQLVLDKHKEKQKLIDELAKLQEKANAEHQKKMLKDEKERLKQAEEAEKESQRRRDQRHKDRYKNIFKYFRSFEGIKALFQNIMTDINGVSGGLSKMAGNLAQMAGLSPAMQGLARAFGGLGASFLAAAAAGAALLAALKFIVTKIDEYQKQMISLKVLLNGDVAATRDLMDRMMSLAAGAGFATQTMFELAEALMNVGISAMEVQRVGTVLAGLAGGSEQRLKSIAKAYSDVMMKGRLMGQEALQFANAGVPIYKALADMLQVSTGQVRTMMEEGQISAEQMASALQHFAAARDVTGQMEENMRTVSGQFARMRVLIDQIVVRFTGSELNENIASIVGSLNDMLKLVADNSAMFGELYRFSGGISTFFKSMVASVPLLGPTLKMILDIMGMGGEAPMTDHEKMMEDLKKQNEQNKRDEEAARQKAERMEAEYEMMLKKLKLEYTSSEAKARADYEEYVMSQDITDEKKKQLMIEYDKLEAMKLQREEQRQAIEDARRESERKVNEEAERQRRAFAGATAKAGPSFEAGGRGEFNFLRDLLLGRRQNSEELRIMKEQEKTLKEIKANSDAQLAELAEMSPDFVGPVMPVGGP
jgi:tape measure domain-containing protein